MDLIDFVIEAKISGYATGGEGQETVFDDGSTGFVFESQEYRYLDRYYGFNPFSGTEFVFDAAGKLIWMMNYFGKVNSSSNDPTILFEFLKQAMLKISRDFPFRGPPTMKQGPYIYENSQSGSMTRFQGIERILKAGKELYSLNYHGGAMA